MQHKSTVEEIRARFDADVERFSNLETGQSATPDAPLVMDLVTSVAAAAAPPPVPGRAHAVLDIGCGAGNYTLKLMQKLPGVAATLLDLSQPMLTRAAQRITAAGGPAPVCWQGDVREVDLGRQAFDIVLAAQTLHHLRDEAEWRDVFTRIHAALRPGGGFWLADSIAPQLPAVEAIQRKRWGDYLVSFKGEAYRDHVFAYVEQEDSPRPLMFQLDLMRAVGFAQVEVLHLNMRFAAFGGVRA